MSIRSLSKWDVPTRITHWALALCVILNLFVLEEGEDPHQWVGYTAVAFVLFRLIWARFAWGPSGFRGFPLSPASIKKYLKNKLSDDSTELRHNPLSAWAYIFMWFAVIALGVTGWMMGLDAFWGDETLESIHGKISILMQILIGAHLVGVTVDSLRYKRKTWLGMITGRRD